MKKRGDHLKALSSEILELSAQTSENLQGLSNATGRVSDICQNAEKIVNDIDREFAVQTKLDKTDIALLFLTTGLLVAKWVIMGTVAPLSFDYGVRFPTEKDIEQRYTAAKGDELAEATSETEKIRKKREKLQEKYNSVESKTKASKNYESKAPRTVGQILFRPVPYDAMELTDGAKMVGMRLPVPLGGTNHHAYTFGHDPVFGWIIGPINIITRSITIKRPDMPTFPVQEAGNLIDAPQSFIIAEVSTAIHYILEDYNRLTAAICKQAIHFVSDKYTKTGLPLPFLPAEKAQEFIEAGLNSVEAEKELRRIASNLVHDTTIIAAQFALSWLINQIVRTLYLLIKHKEGVFDLEMCEVKVRKILLLSNCIATSSNVLYVAINTVTGDKTAIRRLDIGGIIETTHRLISDRKFIRDIKREFIEKHWYETVIGEDIFLEGESEDVN